MNNQWNIYKLIKQRELTDTLFKKSRNLEEDIRKNLGGIGYEF